MIDATIAFHRFGLGPRPGDLDPPEADALPRLEAEIAVEGIALLDAPSLPGSPDALRGLAARNAVANQAPPTPQDTMVAAPPAASQVANPQQLVYRDEIAARLARYRAVDVGFVERLVAFWTNHFAVEAGAGQTERVLAGPFEREAIRPHVLGSFREMLVAVTRHPAMLSYLDNVASIGPGSTVGLRTGRGLNENHARELLELHTVGVDGGYSQSDVTALARAMTGWSFGGPRGRAEEVGRFVFRAGAHEPGPQTIMGRTYSGRGEAQASSVFDDLAAHPAMARHVAFKFARHFIADDPPGDLVAQLVEVFTTTGGDLKALALALVRSDAASAPPTKLKSPQEFLWSAIRALDLDIPPALAIQTLRSLGQTLWDPPSPEGFHDDTATWLAADAMTNRLDIAEILAGRFDRDHTPSDLAGLVLGPGVSAETMEAIDAAQSREQGLALLLMSPEFQRR